MSKIKISPEQLRTLQARLMAPAPELVSDHLTADEFIGYEMESLSPEDQARIDAHLDSCDECSERMDHLVTVAAAWHGMAGKQRLMALRNRLLANEDTWWDRLRAQLDAFKLPSASLAAAAADTLEQPVDGQTENGLLRWRVVADSEHNLTVRLGSHWLPSGTRIRVYAGEQYWETVLETQAADQVGAEVSIPQAVRVALPFDSNLRFEIIHPAE